MIRYYLTAYTLLLLFTTVVSLEAQNIPRKGNLGVSLKQAEQNDKGATLAIAEVFPNSTASGIGLQTDDLLLTIDGISISSTQEIPKTVGKYKAGEETKIEVLRAGKKVKLKGTIIAAPLQAHSPAAEIILDEVAFREGYIRSYINKPRGKGPFKTIYYIQGYPCGSVNYPAQLSITRMIQDLVDLGYAVYRVEKPGAGEYVDCEPCINMTFDDEVEGFTKGYEALLNYDFVNKEEVYIFGHSLGGNVAPILANRYNPAGLMVYGTVAKPYADYALDMARYSQAMIDKNPTRTEQDVAQLKPLFQKVFTEGTNLASLNAEERKLMTHYQGMSQDKYILGRHYAFWKSFAQHNFINHWSQVETPTLAMYGSMDIQAISALDAEYIAALVNMKQPGNGSFKLIEGSNHLLAKVSSKAEELDYIVSGQSGQVASTRYNTDFPMVIHEWIKAQSKTILFENKSQLMPQELTQMASMDVAHADLDNDGDQDIIIATEFGPNRVFLMQADGTFKNSPIPGLKEYSGGMKGEDSEDIALGDFDKDGFVDLFFVSEDTPLHELYFNKQGKGFEVAAYQIPKKGEANAVLVYDFNQDGYDDILLGIRGQNELYINQKNGEFKEATAQYWIKNTDATQDLVAADLDGDGDMDIIEGIEDGGNNLLINEGGKFVERNDWLPAIENIETRKVMADDIDGDGDIDLLYCNVAFIQGRDPKNSLLLNNGDGHFTDASELLPEDYTLSLDAVLIDANGDGQKDIFLSNFVGGQGGNNFKLLINTSTKGLPTFKDQSDLLPVLPAFGGIGLIRVDFNGDGKEDLYLSNFKSKDYLLYGK